MADPRVPVPLAGPGLLEAIRSVGVDRPMWDPGTAGVVRSALEDAVGSHGGALDEDVVLTTGKRRLNDVLCCEARLVAELGDPDPPGPAMLGGALLDLVVAQVIAGTELGHSPLDDALVAAQVTGDEALVDDVEALGPDDRRELAELVNGLGRDFQRRWPALPPAALARVQEPMRAVLAGGRIVISGRADLVVGQARGVKAGATVIDFKSGRWRPDHRDESMYYAVLETLRSGVPPFQSGVYYLTDGSWRAEIVTPPLLFQAVARLGEGLSRLVRLAGGAAPHPTPNPLCPWCPALSGCAPGRSYCQDHDIEVADDRPF